MRHKGTRIVAALVTLAILIGLLSVLNMNRESKEAGPPGKAAQPAPNGPPAIVPRKDAGETIDAAKGSAVEIDVPFLGKVPTKMKEEMVTWQAPDGRAMQFNFKFYYAENGVWIRAECVRAPQEYEETTTHDLQGMYAGQGETITGIPPKPTSWSVQRLLTTASKRWNLDDATKIVLEYVMLQQLPSEEVEPWLMIKAWGVEVLGRNQISAARILIKERTGDGWVDNAL